MITEQQSCTVSQLSVTSVGFRVAADDQKGETGIAITIGNCFFSSHIRDLNWRVRFDS